MKEPVYEVFARKTRDEPLRHIGYINALNGELARVCAWKTYDEQNWFEMCVVPRSAILPVNLRRARCRPEHRHGARPGAWRRRRLVWWRGGGGMNRAENLIGSVEKSADLAKDTRSALRSLILTLADSKRLLGIRYSDWMLGAPTLETGIAASSMAQDEWGHSRLTYALLSDFGDEPRRLEHEREADEYHSMAELDAPFRSWSEMIAAALLLDGALAMQYAALAGEPLHPGPQPGAEAARRGGVPLPVRSRMGAEARAERRAARAVRGGRRRFLAGALNWFGGDEEPSAVLLREEGLVTPVRRSSAPASCSGLDPCSKPAVWRTPWA
jgi:hypothetical protein